MTAESASHMEAKEERLERLPRVLRAYAKAAREGRQVVDGGMASVLERAAEAVQKSNSGDVVSLLPISITEEVVLNPDALPEALRDWRYYRIEYGGPNEACLWEGKILLPRSADPQVIETLLLGLQAQAQIWTRIEPEEDELVECKFCHKPVPAKTAHRHEHGWVGDECCWDERLRATE